MARPTDYTPEMITKVREYLATCGDIVYEVKTRPLIKDGKHCGEEEYNHKKAKIPTIEGVANYLGLNKDTIYDWEKHEDKKPFSDVINELRQIQADMLMANSLTGDYSPVIAKVLLTKHGYRDAIDTDVTTKGKEINPTAIATTEAMSALKIFGDEKGTD